MRVRNRILELDDADRLQFTSVPLPDEDQGPLKLLVRDLLRRIDDPEIFEFVWHGSEIRIDDDYMVHYPSVEEWEWEEAMSCPVPHPHVWIETASSGPDGANERIYIWDVTCDEEPGFTATPLVFDKRNDSLAYFATQIGLCRKVSSRLRGTRRRTQLCCQRGKHLKGAGTVGRDLTLADHVRGLDAGDGCRSRVEGLEAHHRPGDPLDEAMVLFKDIVQIFGLSDRDCAATVGKLQDRVHRLQTGPVGTTLVDDDPVGHAVRTNRPLKEAPGGGKVSVLGQHEIKGLSVAIHRPVKVSPAALHLDVRFVHPPGVRSRSLTGLSPDGDERRELHHPAVQGGVVNHDAALGQNFFKITVGHGVAEVEENRVQDHRLRIVHALELDHVNSLSPTH